MALSRVAGRLLRPVLSRNPSPAFSTKAFQPATSRMWVPDNPSEETLKDTFGMDTGDQKGLCMPLSKMRIGTVIHHIELRPGQGPKIVRAAGSNATIMTDPTSPSSIRCEIKLPSGQKKLIRTSCRAIIGPLKKFQKKKLYKAGQSRWLGIRPTVRGVAMNPCDHPHGGGEGKSKSSGSFGQCSRTPWGKPTKSGYKTRSPKKKTLL